MDLKGVSWIRGKDQATQELIHVYILLLSRVHIIDMLGVFEVKRDDVSEGYPVDEGHTWQGSVLLVARAHFA